MNNRRRILGLGLSVIFLAGLFSLVDSSRFVAVLLRVHLPTYAVAVTLFTSTYLLVALRWQVLARAVDIDLTLSESTEITALSYGINKLLPANAGDLARSKITDEYTTVESHSELLGLVVVERLADLCTICLVVCVGIPLVFDSSFLSVVAVSALAVAAIASLLVFDVGERVRSVALLPASLQSALDRALSAMDSVTGFQLWFIFGTSVVRWLLIAGVFVVLATSVGLSVPFVTAAMVTAAMSLTATLPLSPGGIGPVDAVGTGMLVVSGFASAEALSLVVLQRSLGLGLMALVGFVIYNYRLWFPPEPS
jgi:uncharacterized protein (TIRG00374 family)